MTRRKRNVLALTCAIALAAGWALCSATYGEKLDSQPKLRIGTYKSYILAVAYYSSDMFKKQMSDIDAQIKQAEADGKAELLKQLNAKGRALQQRAHMQLRGLAPADNILAHMKDALPKIAQASGVEAISGKVAYHSPAVELLDITDALVGQLNPSEETLKAIKSMMKHHSSPMKTK